MNGIKLRRLSTKSAELCFYNITNIKSFNQQKISDVNFHRHLHRILPRCLYHSSHSLTQQQKYYNENIAASAMYIPLTSKNLLSKQNFSLLQMSYKNNQIYQSKRFFGDLPVGGPFRSNAPIGQYEAFVKLLADSAPVEFFQNLLISVHSCTGLPWWATIILLTSCLRMIVTLPLSLYQQYIFAKYANIKLEMNDIVKDLKKETNLAVDIYGWTETYARSVYNRSLEKHWKGLIIKNNCHPMKGMVVIVTQIPIWIFLSASLRNLVYMEPRFNSAAYEIFLQLSAEGFGWISNLTAIDSYFIVPVSLCLFNLMNIEIQSMLRVHEQTKRQKFTKNIYRAIAVMMVPLASVVPSCMSLYWVTSCVGGIAQSFIIVSPRVRRFVGIPETEFEIKQPYQHLCNKLTEKYSWIYKKK